jgi:hypothetical protein
MLRILEVQYGLDSSGNNISDLAAIISYELG